MKNSEPIILPTDEEAAAPCTLSGWKSRDGCFYTGGEAETTARWHGATHTKCTECGCASKKPYTVCQACRDKRSHESWMRLPERDAVEGEPVYSELLNEYFFDIDYACDEANERGIPVEDLQLVCCEQVFAKSIDTDIWADDLPEDQDPPMQLVEAVEAFNKAIEGLALSWQPGRKRVRLASVPQDTNHAPGTPQ